MRALPPALALLLLVGCRTAVATAPTVATETLPPTEQRAARDGNPAVRDVRIERRDGMIHFALSVRPTDLPLDPAPSPPGCGWYFYFRLIETADPGRQFELAPYPHTDGEIYVSQLATSAPLFFAPFTARPGLVTFVVPESVLTVAPLRYRLVLYRCIWNSGERDWYQIQYLEGYEDAAPLAAEALTIRICDVQARPQGAAFSVTFSDAPDTTLTANGWPRHEFQFHVWHSTASWSPPQGDVIVRGWEVNAGGIAIRDPGPEDPSPYSGGWGPLRGVVPFELHGPTVRFLVPWTILGDDDGAFRWRLMVTEDGATTDSRDGETTAPHLLRSATVTANQRTN